MKVLFFPIYPTTPHIETELELISNHLENGDDVYFCFCRGNYESCFNNIDHNKSHCILCQSKYKQGLNLLDKSKIKIIPYPKVDIDYSVLPKQFSNVRELMDFEVNGQKVGLAATSTLITTHCKDHGFDTIKFKSDVHRELRATYYAYNMVKAVLKEIKPDMTYFFNGRLSKPKAFGLACKDLGYDFYTHERAGIKGKYITRKNTFPHDIFLVQDEIEEFWNNADPEERMKIGKLWFSERREGVEQSWYSYTHEQKKDLLPEGFDENEKNVVIFNSTMEESYTLPEFQILDFYPDEINGITQIMESFKNSNEIHFYLRVHPNLKKYDNTQTRSYREIGSKYSNITVIPPDSPVNSYALLDKADIVVIFGSTIGLEACYSGKPVILGAQTAYDKLDVVYQVTSHQNTIDLLKSDLKPKNKENAYKYGFWEKNYGIPFKNFEQFSLDRGLFKGKRIKPSNFALLHAAFYRLFELKSISKVIKMGRKNKIK
jgi:capsular polysaccharide biosynthesis protein